MTFGKITFLTVLNNFVPLTNDAFKISKGGPRV